MSEVPIPTPGHGDTGELFVDLWHELASIFTFGQAEVWRAEAEIGG